MCDAGRISVAGPTSAPGSVSPRTQDGGQDVLRCLVFDPVSTGTSTSIVGLRAGGQAIDMYYLYVCKQVRISILKPVELLHLSRNSPQHAVSLESL
jgi:hypothetical protein